MALPIVGYAASTGRLRETYDRMRERPLPPVYRPAHGGVPGIIEAHSLDEQLIPHDLVSAAMARQVTAEAWEEKGHRRRCGGATAHAPRTSTPSP